MDQADAFTKQSQSGACSPLFDIHAAAYDVVSDMLHLTDRGMTEDRFDLFAQCFSLPLTQETFEGIRITKTIAELREWFDAAVGSYGLRGVTHLDRHCFAAEYSDQHTIKCGYEARVLAGNVLLSDPIPVYAVFKWGRENWQISRATYAVTRASALNDIILTPGNLGNKSL